MLESRTRPRPKQWPKHTQHHTAARPSRSRFGASSLLPFLTCLDSPRRASDSLSSPQAGGAGRANGARLDGLARPGPLVKSRPTNFPGVCPLKSWMRNDARESDVGTRGRTPTLNRKSGNKEVLALGTLILKGISEKSASRPNSCDAALTSTPTITISRPAGRAFLLQSKSRARGPLRQPALWCYGATELAKQNRQNCALICCSQCVRI